MHPQRGQHRHRVGDDRDPAVVGDVEGLVCVGCPGIGIGQPRDEVTQRGGRGGPQAEGAIDVHPRTMPAGNMDRLRERIEGTRVDVASLQADDQRVRRIQFGKHRGQRIDSDSSLLVGRDEGRRTKTQVPHRDADRLARSDLFDRRCCRTGITQSGVLVPRAHQPVGGQRGRKRPADHPAEEPTGRHRHQARLGHRHQQLDHVLRRTRVVRQVGTECGRQLVGGSLRPYSPIVERTEPRPSVFGGTSQRLLV